MKAFLVLLFALTAIEVSAQEFLGRWTLVKVFTTANYQKTDDNRMLTLIHQAVAVDSKVDGVLLPAKTEVEFSINPNNQAQHITLTSDGLLLMSMNWKAREAPLPPVDAGDPTLQVWLDGVADYDLYSILFNDSTTLVFSDKSREGSRFLDIYYLERAGSAP